MKKEEKVKQEVTKGLDKWKKNHYAAAAAFLGVPWKKSKHRRH